MKGFYNKVKKKTELPRSLDFLEVFGQLGKNTTAGSAS